MSNSNKVHFQTHRFSMCLVHTRNISKSNCIPYRHIVKEIKKNFKKSKEKKLSEYLKKQADGKEKIIDVTINGILENGKTEYKWHDDSKWLNPLEETKIQARYFVDIDENNDIIVEIDNIKKEETKNFERIFVSQQFYQL